MGPWRWIAVRWAAAALGLSPALAQQSASIRSATGTNDTSSTGSTTVASGGGIDSDDSYTWQTLRVVGGVVAVLLILGIAGAIFHRRRKLHEKIADMRKRYRPPTVEYLEQSQSKAVPGAPSSDTRNARIRSWIESIPYGGVVPIPTVSRQVPCTVNADNAGRPHALPLFVKRDSPAAAPDRELEQFCTLPHPGRHGKK